MNVLRRKENNMAGEAMGRLSRWHALMTSRLLTEYDRKEVTVTPTARSVAARTLPQDMFHGAKSNVSIGVDVLECLQPGAQYPAPCPQAAKLIGPAWLALREHAGDFDKVKLCRMSLLAEPKLAIIDKNGDATKSFSARHA